jgi:hypothetical protein
MLVAIARIADETDKLTFEQFAAEGAPNTSSSARF